MIHQLTSIFEIWNNHKKDTRALRAIRQQKLRKLIEHCYQHVPHYKKLFHDLGLHSSDFMDESDLHKLPILDKGTVRAAGDRLVSQRYERTRLIRQKTGGSTGIPIEILKTPRANGAENAAKFRTYWQNGYKAHYKIAVAQHLTPRQKLFHRFGVHREYDIPYSDPIELQIQRIASIRAEVIDAQPNRIELMARYLLTTNTQLDHVKLIFTHSEKMTEHQRNLVIEAFGINPIDCYGCTESSAIAAECQEHSGYHINNDIVIVELVPAGEGEGANSEKKILVTNLENHAMPLIRYEVGDFAIEGADRCPCGSNFPMLSEIVGRTNDFLLLPSGEKVSGFVVTRIIEESKTVLQYRAKQTADGRLKIALMLEPGESFSESRLIGRIKEQFPSLEIEFDYPDRIDLSPRGKLCRFESELFG